MKAVKAYLKLLPPSAQLVALMLGISAFFGAFVLFAATNPAAALVTIAATMVGWVLYLIATLIQMAWLDD